MTCEETNCTSTDVERNCDKHDWMLDSAFGGLGVFNDSDEEALAKKNLRWLDGFADAWSMLQDVVARGSEAAEAFGRFLATTDLERENGGSVVTMDTLRKKYGGTVPQTLIDYKAVPADEDGLSLGGDGQAYSEIGKAYGIVVERGSQYARKPGIFARVALWFCNLVLRPFGHRLYFRRFYGKWDADELLRSAEKPWKAVPRAAS